jgi:hypothetical protein
MYDENNEKHYDYFDYLDDNKNIVQSENPRFSDSRD